MSLESELRIENVLHSLMAVLFIFVTSLMVGYIGKLIARLRGLTEKEQRNVFWGATFAGPWIVGFLIFVLGPSLASLYYSLTSYVLGEPLKPILEQRVSLDNYRNLILGEGAHGRRFNEALYNSFYYALVGVPLQIMAALAMAVLLNRELPGIKVFRTIFYLPVILAGGPAVLLAWRYMFAGNGGFVNLTLQNIAKSFTPLGWLYRAMIFGMEAFSGFFAGLTRSDPVGPLKYALPAALGVLLLLTLRGDWHEDKRIRAWRSIQVLALIILGFTVPKGIIEREPNLSWSLFATAVILGMILVNGYQGKRSEARLWQIIGIAGYVVGIALALRQSDFALTDGSTPYIMVMGLGLWAVLGTLIGKWIPLKVRLVGALIAILVLVIFARMLPDQMGEGRYKYIPTYLTFGSTLENISDQAYLEDVYPAESLSALWIYGLVLMALLGVALLHRQRQLQQFILYGGLVIFLLIAVSAFRDGQTYFDAFENAPRQDNLSAVINYANGEFSRREFNKAANDEVYHFALFRGATDDFPSINRVPLWLTNELWTKPSLLVITMWSSGGMMLIFLAALKGVPSSLYEAAEVDGANGIQKFFKITIPMISPAMFYNMVIGMVAALQTFDSIYVISTPQTEDSMISAAFFLFNRTFRQLAIGEGAAASWILAVIIVTLTLLQFRWSRWVHYEA